MADGRGRGVRSDVANGDVGGWGVLRFEAAIGIVGVEAQDG